MLGAAIEERAYLVRLPNVHGAVGNCRFVGAKGRVGRDQLILNALANMVPSSVKMRRTVTAPRPALVRSSVNCET